MTTAWSVMPKLVRMLSGAVALTSGRPGLGLWLSTNGSSWRHFDVIREHNILVPQFKMDGSETSAYTGLVEVEPNVLLLTYDKVVKRRSAHDLGLNQVFAVRINVSDGSTVALKSDDSSSVLAPALYDPVDVAVYGSSGAACIAAIAAARSGVGSVLLLSQTNHVGGMLTGGLMHTDAANADVIQGFTREFFMRTTAFYEDMGVPANATRGGPGDSWLFESHVGERVLEEMMAEAHVTVVRSVGGVVSVARSGTRIERVVFESGPPYSATVWIDASYEGAILERVATMVWGREGKDEYNESAAGRGEFQGITGSRRISPYWSESAVPYDTPSNIIPHVAPQRPAAVGAADLWMEPYDFRLCFTNSPGNRMPFTKPASYNASEWEFWRRVYVLEPPKTLSQAGLNCVSHIPNNFSDCGEKACLKCDMLGMNHGVKC